MLKTLSMQKKELLLTPGPVVLSSPVKKALAKNMWHHRSFQFEKILKQVSLELKELFQTQQEVLILSSTGTGAMEAALSNTLSAKDEVLCVCAGKFGERWKEIAQAFDIKVHCIDVPLGMAVCVETVKTELLKNPNLKALLISACETSTATQQPIKEISKILKNQSQILFIVDGITGVGAMELNMDEWGIDVLVAASQKSFMLPAGLAFIALSQKAWKTVEASSCPKYYFDLTKERKAQAQGQTAFSSSVTLIRALNESLILIKKQGLKFCILKCQTLKKSTHVFCKEMGLALYSLNPANSVTAIEIPENLSATEIKKNIEKNHSVILAGGQGGLKNKILRIGHLGFISYRDHLRGLKALALELNKKDPKTYELSKIKSALKKARKTLQIS